MHYHSKCTCPIMRQPRPSGDLKSNFYLTGAQTHAIFSEWAHTITAEDVNREAASLLAFAGYYGKEAEVLEDAERNADRYAPPGPTRATSIVACYPAYIDPSGESVGESSSAPAEVFRRWWQTSPGCAIVYIREAFSMSLPSSPL